MSVEASATRVAGIYPSVFIHFIIGSALLDGEAITAINDLFRPNFLFTPSAAALSRQSSAASVTFCSTVVVLGRSEMSVEASTMSRRLVIVIGCGLA
jgi:hypothetical protein